MPHLRSPESLVRREAKRYIVTYSFQDRIQAETVCLSDPEQVKAYLEITFDQTISDSAIPDIEKGLVLVDNRGRGTFQK